MSRAEAFGRRHPRLTGLVSLPFFVGGAALGWARLRAAGASWVLVAVSLAVGVAVAALLLSHFERPPVWVGVIVATFCFGIAILGGRRGEPLGPTFAAATLLAAGGFFTTVAAGRIAGAGRSAAADG